MLRSDAKDRIEALARGVQSGIYSPNEARASEDLPTVAYGDKPRVQAQVVPLSAAGTIPHRRRRRRHRAEQPDAVKGYQSDLDAMRARRAQRHMARSGETFVSPHKRAVVRKTKQDALRTR